METAPATPSLVLNAKWRNEIYILASSLVRMLQISICFWKEQGSQLCTQQPVFMLLSPQKVLLLLHDP